MTTKGPDMTRYMAYIGLWDHGRPTLLENDLSWDMARNLIAERLRAFEGDECETCRVDAAEALAELEKTPIGNLFEANIDGEDYMIRPSDH